MRFRTAVKLSTHNRYIQRENGRTLFDVKKYQPELIDQEDHFADDWVLLPNDEQLKYFH